MRLSSSNIIFEISLDMWAVWVSHQVQAEDLQISQISSAVNFKKWVTWVCFCLPCRLPLTAVSRLFITPFCRISSLMPCSWRRWTSRRSMASTNLTSRLSKPCGQTQGSRRPMTAAESTSSLTPLNSTSVCVCVSSGMMSVWNFKNGICVTVCDTTCAYVFFFFLSVCLRCWFGIHIYQPLTTLCSSFISHFMIWLWSWIFKSHLCGRELSP